MAHGEVARDLHGAARPLEHARHLLAEGVALGDGEVLVDASRDGARAVNLLAGSGLDHFLAESPHHHSLHCQVGILGGDRQHVALGGRRRKRAGRGAVGAEEQVRTGQMEEMERVALEDLAAVHQPPDLLGGGSQLLAAHDPVHGLGGGQVVADGADSAQPLDDHRHFPIRPAQDEPLEAAELDDVQPRFLHLVVLVHEDRHLAVAFDAGHRLDGVLDGLPRSRAFGGDHGVSRI